MACWVVVTMVAGLSGAPIDAEKSALNRDYLSVLIPLRPRADAVNAGARTTVITTRGASFSIAETTEAVLSAPCRREMREPSG